MRAQKAGTTHAEPRIWSSVIRGLELPLIEHNLDPDILLKKCEIEREDLKKTQNSIPLRKYLKFIEIAAQEAGDPLLGIKLARAAGPETLGAIGFLFLSSRTLVEGLSNFCTYINLLQGATHVQLVQDSEEITFTYQLIEAANVECRQDIEFSLALMCRLIRMYGGKAAEISAIKFRHEPAAEPVEYRRLIQTPVLFEQDNNSVVLPSSSGQIKGNVLDNSLFRILQESLDEQLDRKNRLLTLSDQITEILFSENIAPPFTAHKIADYFEISEATLHRKLKLENISLSRLVDGRNFEIAKEYLSQTHLTITEIAHLVGFVESASFTRAFKRWSGNQTPSQFRKASLRKKQLTRRNAPRVRRRSKINGTV